MALGIALLVAMFVGLGYVGYRWMSSDAVATLVELSGRAERDRASHVNQWRPADPGATFDEGDGARTSEASEARFSLFNGAQLYLKPASSIRFRRPGSNGELRITVDVGEADVTSGVDSLVVESEFGAIVLEANSTVRMTRDADRLSLAVELGRLQFAGSSVQRGDRIELTLGGILVDPRAEPEAPAEPTEPTEPPAPEAPAAPPLELGNGTARADLVVKPGGHFVVHDPAPPTAVGFRVADVCSGAARVRSGAQFTEAVGQANLAFARGTHAYEVRCMDAPDVVAARGTFRVLQDSGTRALPTFAPVAQVATDGRLYTVMYQHQLPNVTVSWPTAPAAESYTLKIGGRSIGTKAPQYTFRALHAGKHQVTFSAATTPQRESRTTTIEVVYDTQAPAAWVSTSAESDGELRGQALPGWSVTLDDQPVTVDPQQKFSVPFGGRDSVPLEFSHPRHGSHYYVRRRETTP